MWFGLLGPVQIVADGGVVVDLAGRRKLRVLAAVLAGQANRPVSPDVLVEALWGSAVPRGADSSLRVYVHRLRMALGGGRIGRRAEGYVIELGPDELDVERFEALVADGRAAVVADDLEQAAGLLEAALGLWRGPALAGLEHVPFFAAEVVRLEELRLQTLEQRFDVELTLGRAGGVIAELRALTGRHPLRETFHGQLMRALIGTGRGAEAIEAFEDARRVLAEELGLDPGPQLRELHLAVLRNGAAPAASTGAPATAGAPAVGRPRPDAPSVPRQLPIAMAGFAGRIAWLARLDALLTASSDRPVPVAVISGGGGIGKTTLAVHWAHRVLDRFPDGHLYANLRGFDAAARPASSFDVLEEFLDALGLPPERIPGGAEARVRAYRTMLAERRMLVVLDNARDAEQVRPLLPGAHGCRVIVTSRNQLVALVTAEGAQPMPLDLFNQDEANDLLSQRLGAQRVAAEPAAAARILDRCAGLPLALSIVAARLATNPRLSLAAVADELQRTEPRLDPFADEDASTDIRTVFSWSYRLLDPDASRVFRLLGLLDTGPDIGLAAVAVLADRPMTQTRPLLGQLVRGHLLIEATPGRYAFHDLLRAYAAELAGTSDPAPERAAALRRLLDHYLSTAHAAAVALGHPLTDLATTPTTRPGEPMEGFAGCDTALAWLAAERATLIAAVDQADACDFPAHAWQIARVLQGFLATQGRWLDLQRAHEAGLAAAGRDRHPAARAAAHRGVAFAAALLGDHDRADDHLLRAQRLFHELGDLVNEGYTYHNLSTLRHAQGRCHEGFDLGRRALGMFQQAEHPRGQVCALNTLAWELAKAGDYESALPYGQQALELHRRTGVWQRESSVLQTLAQIHLHLGQRDTAMDHYRQAVELCRRAGNRHLEAAYLTSLGQAYHADGQDAAAIDALNQAKAIIETFDYTPARRQTRDFLTHLRHDRIGTDGLDREPAPPVARVD
jgi:DNA-binding SARP family transcriptional activator